MANGENMGNLFTNQDRGADFNFPQTLEGFNLRFVEGGHLRDFDGQPFTFKVKEDHRYNQKRYEAIGKIMDEHVYGLLAESGLKRITLAEGGNGDGESFVFGSEDLMTNKEKLLVLIHGSGVVRAGQWARRLIINDGLEYGTQLPYIRRGMDEGYAILVLNTNLNTYTFNGEKALIKGHGSPEEHGLTVWDKLIAQTPAKDIVIVAHSYGGIVTTETAKSREESFLQRVTAVAFTDSVHSLEMQKVSPGITDFHIKHAVNWVSSEEPLDTPIDLPGSDKDAPCVSAGNPKHEWTSWSAKDSVFKFFEEKIRNSDKKVRESPPSEAGSSEVKMDISMSGGDDDKAVINEAATDKDSGDKTSDVTGADIDRNGDKASTDKATYHKEIADKATDEKSADETIKDKESADKKSSEEATSDMENADTVITDIDKADKTITEKDSVDKDTTEKSDNKMSQSSEEGVVKETDEDSFPKSEL